MVIFIGSRGGGNLDAGYHRTAAHCLAARRDQAVGESKSPQTGGMGCMPFGPGGSKAETIRHLPRPLRKKCWGYSLNSGGFQGCHHMFT